MITIECLKCHKTITMDKQIVEEMKFCPFCMNPLREEGSFDEIDSFGKAIYQAVKKGIHQSMNPKAIKGILLDETPRSFETELSKFNRVLGDKHFVTIINAFELDLESADRELNKLDAILTDVEGFHPKWVEETLGYCRKAMQYYHVENLQVKLNYVIHGQEEIKPITDKLSDDEIKDIVEEAGKFYASKDYEKAYKLYLKAAEQGNAEAQLSLGGMYELGYGVQKDDAKACAWYEKAAEQGDVLAQERSALIYCNGGIGVPQDYTKAYEWFLKVAGQTDNIDCATLAQMYLALFYLDGWGVPKDDAKAFEWNQKAAELGDEYAQATVGHYYENGVGVQKDYAKAFEWYQKAAAQGYDKAQNNLGNMYYKGLGVSKDYSKAYEWYQKAAVLGNADAQNNLGFMYKNGCGVSTDETKACEYYRKAALQGHMEAQYRLGYMYENGWGVPKDISKALEWYQKSADQWYDLAQMAIDRIRKNNH